MATLAIEQTRAERPETFFLVGALVMALVLIAGFSTQLVMGRSSFAVPYYIHIHALIFFGWTALYVVQNVVARPGSLSIHRTLGWLAVIWVPAMLLMGSVVTIALVRRGAVPFFFTPLYFLIMNLMLLVSFTGLVSSAIVLRRRTAWHSRLMFSGMTVVLVPGFGRLLPMPLLIPYAGWTVFGAILLFPLAGIVRDVRQSGRVHPAWLWGAGVIAGTQVVSTLIASSGFGVSIYDAATKGYPAAATNPQVYAPPPLLPQVPR